MACSTCGLWTTLRVFLEASSDAGEAPAQVRSSADKAEHTGHGVAHNVKHAAGSAAHNVKHAAGSAAHKVEHAAGSVKHKAGDTAQYAPSLPAGMACEPRRQAVCLRTWMHAFMASPSLYFDWQ